MIGHMLLATDFSARSDRALRRATLLARQLGARLSLVHVVDDDQPTHLIAAQTEAANALLSEGVHTLDAFDGISADARVVTGDKDSAILAAARDAGADLIIIGAHRRQLRDVFVGTTVERVVAHSPLPVLMAAGVPAAPYARALVAINMEEASTGVVKHLCGSGLLTDQDVIAMHAFDAPARGMMHRAMSEQAEIDHYVSGEQLRAAARFEHYLAQTSLRGARPRLMPLNGSAARTILECAAEEEASLIVVGTSQRRGIDRLLLGSTAEDVLGDADRDVLVIPE